MREHDVFLERALVEDRLITDQQLAEARRYALERDIDIIDALTQSKALSGRDIAMTRADVCETAYVDLSDFEVCFANTQLLPRPVADRFCAFPLCTRLPAALDWHAAIDLADAALYEAKDVGRNAWVGLLNAVAANEADLREDARRRLEDWAASGRLMLQTSARPATRTRSRSRSVRIISPQATPRTRSTSVRRTGCR